VRAGFDAVRRGAGDDAFLLGCGVPLSNVVGVVDGNRIGADVAPSWNTVNFETAAPGYERALPATVHSWQNTLARSFLHRKLWLNDPDCLMLRQSETQMTPAAVRTWAHAVAVSGGMALVSATWPCSTPTPGHCSTRSSPRSRRDAGPWPGSRPAARTSWPTRPHDLWPPAAASRRPAAPPPSSAATTPTRSGGSGPRAPIEYQFGD
jgi:hypothetical protein